MTRFDLDEVAAPTTAPDPDPVRPTRRHAPTRPSQVAPPAEPTPTPPQSDQESSMEPDQPPVRTRVKLDAAGPTPVAVTTGRRLAPPHASRVAPPVEPKPAPSELAWETDAEVEPVLFPVRRRRRPRPLRRLAIVGVTGMAVLVLLITSLVANTRAETKAGPADAPAALPPLPPAPPAPPLDPVATVGAATAAEQEIGTREAEVLASLRALDVILREWKPGDLRQEHRALAEYKKVAQSLRAFADRLIRGQDNAGKAIQAYRAALERAPEKLDAAAAVYARYATEEPIETLKSQYAVMGEKAKVISAVYAQRAKALELTEAELRAKMEFVRRSRVFLDRLDAYLDLLAAGQGDGAELQKYLEQLNQYIGHFETSLKQFKLVTDRIAAPPAATVPPKK